MSRVSINNTTNTIRVQAAGARGLTGIQWVDDPWVEGIEFKKFNAIEHNGASWRVIVDHVSDLTNEPGQGVDWQDFWQVLALGLDADLTNVNTVANISSDVTSVSNNQTNINTVAAIDSDVSAVAAIDSDVSAVANNISQIQAAPGFAQDAEDAAELSRKWAEGTEPDGPLTKSSKEYAQDAEAAAIVAASATQVNYAVSVYNDVAVELGTYYAERSAPEGNNLTRIYGEIINGGTGSSVEAFLEINGFLVYQAFTIVQGTPFSIEDLNISVSKGDSVQFVIYDVDGTVNEVFMTSSGVVA